MRYFPMLLHRGSVTEVRADMSTHDGHSSFFLFMNTTEALQKE